VRLSDSQQCDTQAGSTQLLLTVRAFSGEGETQWARVRLS